MLLYRQAASKLLTHAESPSPTSARESPTSARESPTTGRDSESLLGLQRQATTRPLFDIESATGSGGEF